ncbi:DNA polymerase iota isoform X2 [Takifugu flavidus]|uniref:DNA polymerase iota isoform X2 n=1 Tax=Takifugu flavidus TaxID=433684 RepID=UPI0025443A20|nr:DNA polymerase iota isoform X2 [Takifugu flavidus]
MEKSEDQTDEDETEWESSFADPVPFEASGAAAGQNLSKTPTVAPTSRVILHFDLDCFYAQVEMIRNPALREVPLGIQQKYIVVTCNYVARQMGVTKLMSVVNAKEKCPQLVLVKGEDLTHYREMSYKVTDLLMSYCPLVERLGFDENFMDITGMIEKRLAETSDCDFSFKGHVYGHVSAGVKASDHPRLALGSHIAAELREAIQCKLGLTGCAGIATNKLLAKLVSGTFKPNQQTSLLPENIGDIVGCLNSLRKVPGVGHQTAKKLQALGLATVKDLQHFPVNNLVKEFGGPTAQRLKSLVLGVDDSPVTPTGAPQSLSDEDSFKKMSSMKEVLEKIQELLRSLVDRMQKDGRQPQTLRLTIRRYTATNKWFNRESRQAPIPNHIAQKIASGCKDDAVAQLGPLAMKLFHKMVDGSTSFHLTLINVCFSNLQSRVAASSGKASITSFFTHSNATQALSTQRQEPSSHSTNLQLSACSTITQPASQKTFTTKDPFYSDLSLYGFSRKQSPLVAVEGSPHQKIACSTVTHDGTDTTVTEQLLSNVDPEVFKLLPKEIQMELLSSPSTDYATSVSPAELINVPHTTESKCTESLKDVDHFNVVHKEGEKLECSEKESFHRMAETSSSSGNNVFQEEILVQSSDCAFPGNVDPKVFSELPLDIQQELISEWKQKKPVFKSPSSRKPAKGMMSKDRKAVAKNRQANSLLKYFKPG